MLNVLQCLWRRVSEARITSIYYRKPGAEHRGIYAQVLKITTLGGSPRLSLRLGEGQKDMVMNVKSL